MPKQEQKLDTRPPTEEDIKAVSWQMLKRVYKLRHRFLSEIPKFRMTYKAEKLTKAAPLRKKCMHCVATFIWLSPYPIHIVLLTVMQFLLLTLFQPDWLTGQQLKMFSRILWHSWEMFVYCCTNHFNSNLHQLQCNLFYRKIPWYCGML